MLKAIDFFCSAGGVSCGFKQAEIDILGGIDIDKNCRTTYEKNINAKFIRDDIAELPKDRLIEEFGIERNQDNLIFVGCSPCQYYSNIKTDKTKSQETRLLLEDFQDFVDYFNPGYVFIENVPGLEKKQDSPLGRFKMFLAKKCYDIQDDVVNAKYYGVPQNRRRYVLIASRLNDKLRLPQEDRVNIGTVKEVIGNYKIFKPIEAGFTDETLFIHTSAALSELNLERLQETSKDGGDRREWQDNPRLQLKCYIDHEGHYDVYGRMYWEKPSPAITTRFRYISNGRYGHPEQDRGISLREGACLQTFPLTYNFYSSSNNRIAKMIGNAVPPELARRIGQQIKENWIEWRSSEQKHEQ